MRPVHGPSPFANVPNDPVRADYDRPHHTKAETAASLREGGRPERAHDTVQPDWLTTVGNGSPSIHPRLRQTRSHTGCFGNRERREHGLRTMNRRMDEIALQGLREFDAGVVPRGPHNAT